MFPKASQVDTIFKEQHGSDSKKIPPVNSFQELLDEIAKVFELYEVDVDYLKQLMLSYQSNPTDWIKYVNLAEERYTRVLVDDGNGKYNLMLLCWPATVGSTIHNHPDSHCIMKVLAGSLSEIRYCWPKDSYMNVHNDGGSDGEDIVNEMKIVCETRLDKQNSVAYINDSIGLHRVVNHNELLPAFSLHLYCPPFNHCRVFDEKTGKYRNVNVYFDPQENQTIKYHVKHQKRCEHKTTNSPCNPRNEKDVLIFEIQQQQQQQQQQNAVDHSKSRS